MIGSDPVLRSQFFNSPGWSLYIGTIATLNLLIFVGHNNFRRSFQSRGRDRPNRFGGGNRNASNSTAVNGPAVNGRFPV